MKTQVVSRGVCKVVTALVDTGAQVNLIKKGLYEDDHCLPARNPVDLRQFPERVWKVETMWWH